MTKDARYYRARNYLLDHRKKLLYASLELNREEAKEYEKKYYQQGVIPKEHQALFNQQLNQLLPTTDDQPLSFFELSRNDTYFNLHPDKIAGTPFHTSSLYFPVQVKGTKEEVIRTIERTIGTAQNPPSLSTLEAEAIALELELLLLDL
ncbi:hypothetical protein [Algivirga pacifica]|uniref:Uncharacterized protein n=1 Tax=Algivirga pacifica TaxID=1162670 RepID=A0ABP9DC42_9BACT